MSEIVNLKNLKNKKLKNKYIIYLFFIIILIYTLYSIYLIVRSPNDVVTVDRSTLTLEESANGYIIRNETVLTGNNYNNGLTTIVPEGERAAKGQTVFRYGSANEEEIEKKIEELNLKIQEALKNEKNNFPGDVKNLDKQIDEKLFELNKLTDVHTIAEYKKEIEEITSKKAKIAGEASPSGSYIKDLTNQRESLENELTANSEDVVAPVSGIISYRVDGLEESLTPADFSTLTEEKLESLDLKTGKIVATSQNRTEKLLIITNAI